MPPEADRTNLLRLELAACALAATVALTMLVFAIDALRFHRALLGEAFSSASVPVVVLLAIEGVIAGVMTVSLIRQLLRQRSFLARLPAERRSVLGVSVLVIPTRRLHAFCVGWLRPQIVISEGLLNQLSGHELLSVLTHEQHHARRRDPLRRALVKAFCAGLWFIPGLRSTADAQVRISELAADAVAMRSAGVQPLASALVTFEEHGGRDAGPSAERVQHIVGELPRHTAGALSMIVPASVLLALGGSLVYLLQPFPAELCLPLSTALGTPLAVVVLAVACVPAGLLGRTATRVLRVGSPDVV